MPLPKKKMTMSVSSNCIRMWKEAQTLPVCYGQGYGSICLIVVWSSNEHFSFLQHMSTELFLSRVCFCVMVNYHNSEHTQDNKKVTVFLDNTSFSHLFFVSDVRVSVRRKQVPRKCLLFCRYFFLEARHYFQLTKTVPPFWRQNTFQWKASTFLFRFCSALV